jgi:lincosamide nucleotidyltransferase A/C/D/E
MLELTDLVSLLERLDGAGLACWLDGGWGVDALLGEQTRPHADVDIVIEQKDVPRLRELLAAQGHAEVPRGDTAPWNFVLGDSTGRLVDVHAVVRDAAGNGLYGPPERGIMYPAGSFEGAGSVGGRRVRCIAPEWVVRFHSGYDLDDDDLHDIAAVCERFGIEPLPEQREQLAARGLLTIARPDR